MDLKELSTIILPEIEAELHKQISRLDEPITRDFHELLTYHMGWTGEGAGTSAQGKRLRPFLLSLTTAACGTEWRNSLPAGAAVELVHNFSLVHDDIQDHSDTRRGRDTLWKKWGISQGINAGDALFVISNQAIMDLLLMYASETVIRALKILQDACLELTRGQFLDISYERRNDLTIEDYWTMVSGKTAALMSACCHIGALLGGADEITQNAYRNFGHYLGLSFQVQDDIIGIWGDSSLTGKSTNSDLTSGKKSLPVLYGLVKNGKFAQRWSEGPVSSSDIYSLTELLSFEGARLYAQEASDKMTDLALQSLRIANPRGYAGEALFEISRIMLNRDA